MYYKKDNITIFYEKYGNSEKKILILPGWGNTRESFNTIINILKADYTIYIIDYPSFGNSPPLEKEWSIDDYALLIKDFLQENNIYNTSIIAHSFGGRITAILVGKYKIKVDKIILIDVAGIKRRKKIHVFLKEKIYKILKKFTFLFSPIKQEYLRQKLLLIFGSNDYKNIPYSMQKTFQNIIKEDLKKYYKKIYNDTLIIWGTRDKDTPLKDGKYINNVIKNSALIIYKNAEHFSYLNYPYLTVEIIKKFLN